MIIVVLAAAAGVGVALWLALDNDDPDQASVLPWEQVTTTTAEATPEDETVAISVFELGVGNCFTTQDIHGGDGVIVSTVEIIDCTEPHLAVIYDTTVLDTALDEPFPGTEERDEASRALCEPGFERYVGTPLSRSELVMMWLAPTEESWADGDREVACAVSAPIGEQLTEPVAGSGR